MYVTGLEADSTGGVEHSEVLSGVLLIAFGLGLRFAAECSSIIEAGGERAAGGRLGMEVEVEAEVEEQVVEGVEVLGCQQSLGLAWAEVPSSAASSAFGNLPGWWMEALESMKHSVTESLAPNLGLGLLDLLHLAAQTSISQHFTSLKQLLPLEASVAP